MFLHVQCVDKVTPSVIPTITGLRYLALGDSYTYGQSVDENQRFPNQLVDSLALKKIGISNLKSIARTGWTTGDLQQNITAANLKDSTFDVVSLLIGVNNQYRHASIETYKIEFADLLDRAILLANNRKSRVFVVSIPDYAYTPFGRGDAQISREIDDYNAINERISREKGVIYVNITPISREGLSDPSLVANDGLHPSGKQYSRWVTTILPSVSKIF